MSIERDCERAAEIERRRQDGTLKPIAMTDIVQRLRARVKYHEETPVEEWACDIELIEVEREAADLIEALQALLRDRQPEKWHTILQQAQAELVKATKRIAALELIIEAAKNELNG